jgi:hypothetical protein
VFLRRIAQIFVAELVNLTHLFIRKHHMKVNCVECDNNLLVRDEILGAECTTYVSKGGRVNQPPRVGERSIELPSIINNYIHFTQESD